MASTYELENKLNRLEADIEQIRRSNSNLTAEMDYLQAAMDDARGDIEGLESRIRSSEEHFLQESTHLRNALDQGLQHQGQQLEQIDRHFRQSVGTLKDQLEMERNERIATHKRFEQSIEAQQRELEQHKKETQQRFEQERRFLQKSLDELHENLQKSEKRQLREIQKLRKQFEKHLKEKKEAAKQALTTAQFFIQKVQEGLQHTLKKAKEVDAEEPGFRISAKLGLIAMEQYQAKYDKNSVSRQMAANRVLLHAHSAKSDTTAWQRFVEERQMALKTAQTQIFQRCETLRQKLSEAQSLFFPETKDCLVLINELEQEVRENYRYWKTFQRFHYDHLKLLNDIEHQLQRLPEMIELSKACDQQRQEKAMELLKAFERYFRSSPEGQLIPTLQDMDDYRSHRMVRYRIGERFYLNLFFHLNGTFSMSGSPEIRNEFMEYLSNHPVKMNPPRDSSEFYFLQKEIPKFQTRLDKSKFRKKENMANSPPAFQNSVKLQQTMES